MIQRKKKIVLFLPHRADPSRGETFSADLLPLDGTNEYYSWDPI